MKSGARKILPIVTLPFAGVSRAELPSGKMLTAPPIASGIIFAQAWAIYDAGAIHTAGVAALTGRPVEIKEVACERASRNKLDQPKTARGRELGRAHLPQNGVEIQTR